MGLFSDHPPQFPPKTANWEEEEHSPEEKGGSVGNQEHRQAYYAVNHGPVAVYGSIAELRRSRRRHNLELRLIVFVNGCIERGKVYLLCQTLSLRLHALNLTANPAKLSLDREHIGQLPSALLEQVYQPPFSITAIREPRFKVHILRR